MRPTIDYAESLESGKKAKNRSDPTLTPARYTTGIIIDKIIAYEIWA
jgi:hypothetical protein